MSKINAVRIINLNYNDNAIKISDETFHMNGESTLLSLRNGGGKSVLVQMMMAPFVHKRYRDAKDRPFESYFTTSKPTFLLVEWVLDRRAGYVLTGMMVRRHQGLESEQTENLDIINFISEYRETCLADIHHLPVVEKGQKEIVLKNFSACRQLFEELKRDASLKFFCYDMTNYAQSKQYFDKLLEYQVNYKEWESIIKKVNLEESGLSNLFADCRDERGLVEKWFLEAVEGKLNKEKNRIKEFQTITGKYAGQYKDNQSKIKRRDTIRLFREEGNKIEEKALAYQVAEEKKRKQEERIAGFIAELEILKASAEEKLQRLKTELEEIREQIARIEYEKLSGEYYQYEEQQKFHISSRDMIELEREEIERELRKVRRQLSLLYCARQQETVAQEQGDLEELRQKLAVFCRENEDLEPERAFLGYHLRKHYDALLRENRAEQETQKGEMEQAKQDIAVWAETIESLEGQMRQNALKIGALASRVTSYDEKEEQFNRLYEAGLARNILGNYEPGEMEIRRENYHRELEQMSNQQRKRRKQSEDLKECIRGLERKKEEVEQERQQKVFEHQQKGEVQKKYEEELAERLPIMKYLDLGEDEQFETDKILKVSERKLGEIEEIRRSLEKEENELQKEYRKLTQGKVLELPEELEREFADMGIHVVYGMEWLKKNGYTQEQNQEIVHNHPFLPYALILSEKELERLSGQGSDIYTSIPIPIVKREELETKTNAVPGQAVISFSDVSFYVLFNENLLDEEKLAFLVAGIERKIAQKKDSIAVRQQEYREYFERKEIVRSQSVSRERFLENAEALEEAGKQITEMERILLATAEELAGAEETQMQLETDWRKAEKEILEKERQIEDFEQLFQAYEAYGRDCEEKRRCEKEAGALADRKSLASGQLEKKKEQLKFLEINGDNLLLMEKELQEHFVLYEDYRQQEHADGMEAAALDIVGKEARFKAITANMSQELQDLEEQEQKALRRYREAVKELERLRAKYQLETDEWMGVGYSQREEMHLEGKEEDYRQKEKKKQAFWNDEHRKIAVIETKMDNCREQIKTRCGEEKPLAKEEIQVRDFEAAKNQLLFQESQLQEEENALGEILQGYDENLTALAEYSGLTVEKPVEWEENLREMSRKQLRAWKGTLLRDYNESMAECRNAREHLSRVLNQILRMEAFGEEFYRRPLESMLELVDDAAQVLSQLHTTIQSYDSLIEKLEVDISVVEREKEKIIELLEDYVREVHLNLGKIDSNSTVTVRERPLKMLKIQLPEWEENEGFYHIRLVDLLDEVTEKGIEIFERNENAQEYFGTRITTKNLYDTVIGIGNVQIKLYKIEAQREYPITWAEVAKNSGGEGFLSAFVILSSLLYYMRRDDTDFFADRNEGKVLVMDNPFAQTNASHLLKPLMDVAKKANTQLICLTGLGGESIYNRFDNIYVLNLIAASLRSGMQYLKVNHVKGNEPEAVVVSQVEVVEQLELEF